MKIFINKEEKILKTLKQNIKEPRLINFEIQIEEYQELLELIKKQRELTEQLEENLREIQITKLKINMKLSEVDNNSAK